MEKQLNFNLSDNHKKAKNLRFFAFFISCGSEYLPGSFAFFQNMQLIQRNFSCKIPFDKIEIR